MAQQGTGTPQDPIKTKLYFQKKGLVYEVGGGGGGSGGPTQYIKTPVILSPVNEATGVSVLATIRVSEYENLFESDAWANRHVQIAKVGEFTSESIVYDHMEKATEFQVTDPPLPANTTLYIRAKDYSEDGLESEWSNIVMFTTGDAITVNKPELQLFGWHESTSDFVQTIKATGSEFSVTQGQIDNHIKTDWWIEQASTRSNVHIWESMSDPTNLTSITTPEIEALQPSTKYVFCCVYHGEKYGASPVSMKEFTTSSDFGKVNTPTLSVEGGPSDVYETPRLTATAFSNTRDPDTHVSTNWKIVLASDAGGAAVWESTSDMVNKTEITVPKGRLQPSTSYIAMVQYNGQVYGLSEWAQYQFSTVAVFASVNTPSLTVAGAPDAVAERPTLTLSAFGGTNVTYKSSHFKILKNADNSTVWETTSASLSVKVPKSTLEVSTTYKFQGWHESNEGVLSQVAEVVATTKSDFIPINDIGAPDSPTFGVGIATDEEAEAFIPGMTKHPDFYDETKAGYGLWITPGKTVNKYVPTSPTPNQYDYVQASFKYVPKFYWTPLFTGDGGSSNLLDETALEQLLPYSNGVTVSQMKAAQQRAPRSAILVVPGTTFSNEADANAHGFILPAAFVNGGVEKNGFFITPTMCVKYTQAGGTVNERLYIVGENYDPTSETDPDNTNIGIMKKVPDLITDPQIKYAISRLPPGTNLPHTLTRLDSSNYFNPGPAEEVVHQLEFSSNAFDAIRISKAVSPNVQCESCFTVAALCLLSLAAAQYATSTTECAWYDPNGVTNFPKGINNTNADVNDQSVALATAMDTTQGSIFPTTREGYCKTTHNGRINGITHVNGWVWRPMVGYGYWSGAYRLFDCTKHSISEITVDNVDSDTTMFVPVTESIGNAWSEETTTPLYTSASGQARLLNCVFSHSSGNPSATFGNDYHSRSLSPLEYCGGYSTFGANAGVFSRDYNVSGWAAVDSNGGFRAIGYSSL